MNHFTLFASPWWVNLSILVPIVSFIIFKRGLAITKKQLIASAIFGIAFGFVEAAVVVYLRAASGLLLQGNVYQPAILLSSLARKLFVIEFFREIATMVMLLSVAWLTVKNLKEQVAVFIWLFAFWDLFYYIGLWLAIRWPSSLTTQDVLFLIPVPWIAQVWFPCLVSVLCIFVIAFYSSRLK